MWCAMMPVRLPYYPNGYHAVLRECSVSDDGESKSSKLARLSFILINFLRKDESWSETEAILNAKYPMQDLTEEYPPPQYAY